MVLTQIKNVPELSSSPGAYGRPGGHNRLDPRALFDRSGSDYNALPRKGIDRTALPVAAPAEHEDPLLE